MRKRSLSAERKERQWQRKKREEEEKEKEKRKEEKFVLESKKQQSDKEILGISGRKL